jgi:hypothetical protein
MRRHGSGVPKNVHLWRVCDVQALRFVERPYTCPPAPRPPPAKKQKWEFWDKLYVSRLRPRDETPLRHHGLHS